MVLIPEEKISEVSRAADIVEMISESVRLKKAGKNYVGLCPFHSEKTPSFTVSPEKQMFYCFGCGTGGNVFHFLMKQEGISFPEAVRMLAMRYGVELDEAGLSPIAQKKRSEREHLFAVNEMALDYFRNMLRHPRTGADARAYLNRRGFTADTIETFQLGYVPSGWDHLMRHFQQQKMDHHLLLRSGLIAESSRGKGRCYDRFRHRIIFPILNTSRQVIGFGGRVMDDAQPKYLNSPETPVYNKRRSLYGFHESRRICRAEDAVYIVEGYFDFLALWQHGIRNVVATLGTALSSEHLLMLKGAGRNLVLVYDSDTAGIKAALRCVDLFLNDLPIKTETSEKNMEPRILILPEGDDPDSYVFKYGREAFQQAAQRAPRLMTFLIEAAVRRYGLSVNGKLKIIENLQAPLADIEDDFARSLYIRELAERLGGIDEAAILERVRTFAVQKKKASRSTFRLKTAGRPIEKDRPMMMNTGDRTNRMERRIVSMILQFPQIIPEARCRDVLQHMKDSDLKAIVQLLFEHERKSSAVCIAELAGTADNEAQRRLISSLAVEEEAWAFDGCIKLLDQFVENCSRIKDDLTLRIKTAEKNGDQKQLLQLLREKQVRAAEKLKNKRVEPAGGKTI